jgi:hypothetical protein
MITAIRMIAPRTAPIITAELFPCFAPSGVLADVSGIPDGPPVAVADLLSNGDDPEVIVETSDSATFVDVGTLVVILFDKLEDGVELALIWVGDGVEDCVILSEATFLLVTLTEKVIRHSKSKHPFSSGVVTSIWREVLVFRTANTWCACVD